MTEDAAGSPPAPGTFRLAPWTANGLAELTAAGASAQETLQAALGGILEAVRGAAQVPPVPAGAEPAAVPIRGDGADLAALFADLAADLLAQLDANGPDFDRVRLDGLLPTDEGLTAWGYVLGLPSSAPPPTGLALAGAPTISQTAGRDVLRCALRRVGPRP